MTKSEKKPLILKQKENMFKTNDAPMRDGIELEKGAQLTDEYLTKHYNSIGNMLNYFVAYPDKYLDLIATDSSPSLFFYQRIVLRAIMRFKDVYVTAPRAFSKSFITILGLFLQCMFIPHHKAFICAPHKNQSALITKEKLQEIYRFWPLLRREVVGGEFDDCPGNFGKDYVTIKFRNGSQLDVVGATDTTRGGRRHSQILK